MGLERCGYCTAPIYVRLTAAWNDDGTVTGRYTGRTRVVQIYSDEINHILSGIGERIGHDIGRIVVEGERKSGVELTRDMLNLGGGLAGAISRSRLFSKFTFGLVVRAVKTAGFGNCRLVDYRRGEKMVLEFERPFNIPILSGNMLGAFEAFFDKPGMVSWDGDSEFVRITVTGGTESQSDGERLRPRLPVTLPGNVRFSRCPKCDMPLEITRRYQFDLDAGIATEVETGRRIVTVVIDSLNAIFEELAEELGPEIPRMIVDLESDYIKKSTPGTEGPEGRAVRGLLGDLTIKGMGNPVDVSVSDDGCLRVRIDNPFSEELLAGRVLGIYRAVLGEPAEVEWTRDTEGYIIVQVSSPKGTAEKEGR